MSPRALSRPPETLLSVHELRTFFPIRKGLFGRECGSVRAVDGVNFDIARGTTLGLVGESGCGKTTVARSILRLIETSGGEVRFNGVDVLRAPPSTLRRLRRKMQIIFQDPFGSLDPRMTVGRIIAEPLEIHGVATGRRCRMVSGLLHRVGLSTAHADRYPHEFSGGQRQRIGIARAIALQPELIVCDEPVSALDVSIQSQILNLLKDLQREMGVAYLFIAHNLAVVRHLSQRIAVMYLGKIVEIGPAADLFANPKHPYTMALMAASPEPPLKLCVPSLRKTERDQGRHVKVGDIILRGEPPSPIDPPTGCSFHPRCPYAMDICSRMEPKLEPKPKSAAEHLVACHLPDDPTSALNST